MPKVETATSINCSFVCGQQSNILYLLDACTAVQECTGWTTFVEHLKCYLYTGPVYKVPYASAVSGAYNCNHGKLTVTILLIKF